MEKKYNYRGVLGEGGKNPAVKVGSKNLGFFP